MQVFLNDILIDLDTNRIGQGVDAVEVESQSMAVLTFLIAHANALVTRETLFEKIWHGKVVTDNSLHRAIAQLRKALNDDATQPACIKTVHGKGYILVAQVTKPQSRRVKTWLWGALTTIFCVLLMALSFDDQRPPAFKYIESEIKTSLPGIEYHPTLSADGQRLLFIHRPTLADPNSMLMLATDSLSEPRLVYTFEGKVNALAWSRDNEKIVLAIQNQSHCQVWLLEISPNDWQTKKATPLFPCVSHAPLQIAWVHQGDALFVMKTTDSQQPSARLYRFALASNQFTQLHPEQLVDVHGFAKASHSDQLVVYTNDRNQAQATTRLWQIDQTQHITTLAPIALPIRQVSHMANENAWLLLANDRLYSYDLTTSPQEISNSDRRGISNINLAGDHQLVFNTAVSKYHLRQQWFTEDRTSKTIQASSLSQAAGAYHPNGETIAFLSDRLGNGWELWLAEQGQATPIRLPNLALRLATPQWRPDGKALMLLSDDNRLIQVELANHKVSYLTSEPDLVLAGSWHDKESFYYSKPIADTFQLFYKSVNTGEERQLTLHGGYFSQLMAGTNQILFNKRNSAGLWRMDLDTGSQALVLPEFGADNYSRWQLVNNTLYFRHHNEFGTGLFQQDVTGSLAPISLADNVWLFHIAADASKVLISQQEMAYADIKSGYLINITE